MKSLGKNYVPGSMSFSEGFLGPQGDVGFTMKFSMKKAKQIAKKLGNVVKIRAGLDGDFIENSCTIFDGEWHDYACYDHSVWATPIIIIGFKNKTSEAFESWVKVKE